MRKRHILIGLFVPFNNRGTKILKEGRVEAFSNTWFSRGGFGRFREFRGCHARAVSGASGVNGLKEYRAIHGVIMFGT